MGDDFLDMFAKEVLSQLPSDEHRRTYHQICSERRATERQRGSMRVSGVKDQGHLSSPRPVDNAEEVRLAKQRWLNNERERIRVQKVIRDFVL